MKCVNCLLDSICKEPCHLYKVEHFTLDYISSENRIIRLFKTDIPKKVTGWHKFGHIFIGISSEEIHYYQRVQIQKYHEYRLHRIDGPAVIMANGTLKWFKNGKCHRTDGPAIVFPDGSEEWYINGQLHRDDGPAIIRCGKYRKYTYEWWKNGYRNKYC